MLLISSELELLQRLVKDDRAAFDAIYRQYFHAVYNNALKITRDTIIAEDLLQEVFITLWEKRKIIDVSRSVGGWLFVICYNKAVDQLKTQLKDSLALQELQRTIQDTSMSDNTSSYEMQWEMLEKVIARLSPQKRKVFELCKLHGKTYEETAHILDISKYTVKEYLSGAVCFVKEQVKNQAFISVTGSLFLLLA